MSTITFTKMHGAGNDYIYIDCTKSELANPQQLAIKLSDRHFGIGGDGLVLILPSSCADFRMRMFNADGSESEMCGNAVRCIAKFVYEKGLTTKEVINLETKAGIKVLHLEVIKGQVVSVCVDMGTPILDGLKIPVSINKDKIVGEPITVGDQVLTMTCVSMGNPHAVFFVNEITDELVLGLGPKLEKHPFFPKHTNVEFIKILNRGEIQMRVWERGTGETLACGTGACASVVACVLNQLTDKTVKVKLLGGELNITWKNDGHIYKTGPAAIVFEGRLALS